MKAKTKGENEFPETLQEAVKYFANPDVAFNFMVQLRWPAGVKCPRCNSSRVTFTANRKVWVCEDCPKRAQFSIKAGTIMQDSPLGLDKWLCAIWLISSAKNGISSYELHRALGMTQKSAWFVLHRVRYALHNGTLEKMSGQIEADETFIGGKARNMHKSKRAQKVNGTGPLAMTPVMGLLQRGTREQCSKVIVKQVKTRKRVELQGHVRQYVLKGSEIHTDAHSSYIGLCDEYTHNVVDHAVEYVRGHVHTNGLENFWSLLKRSIKGTYVNVEPFHLFRYLDEQAFRFNERKNEDGDKGRFMKAVAGIIGKGLTYAKLTGKESEGDCLRPQAA